MGWKIVLIVWIGLIIATILYMVIWELMDCIRRLKIDSHSMDDKRGIVIYTFLTGLIGGVGIWIMVLITKTGQLSW